MEDITLKKKIIAIILVLFSVFSFSGCSLMSLNASRYTDEVLARVGDETITRNEVSTLYTTYYNAYSAYSSSIDNETIMNTVWSQLINQKIVLNEARKKILLSNEDKNEIWQEVFDSIDDEIEDLMVSEGYKEEKDEEDETEKSGYGYEKTKYIVVDYNPATFDYKENVVIVNVYQAPTEGNELVCFNKFISTVVDAARSNGRNTDKDVAFREYLDRLYKTYEDSKLVEKYEDYLKTTISVSDQEIIDEYNKILNQNLQLYADVDNFDVDMKNTSYSGLVLYAKNSTYFRVQHILIPFSEEQTEELSGLTGADANLDYVYREPYIAKRNELAEKLLVTAYKDLDGTNHESETGFDGYFDVVEGEFVSGAEATLLTTLADGTKKVTVETIEALVEQIMTNGSLSDNDKLAYFNQLMFIYGQDPGMQGTTTLAGHAGYILPDPESEDFEDFAFQTEFKDAAKQAMQNYNTGYTGNGYEVAVSDNGVHIIVFAGVVGVNSVKGGKYFAGSNGSYLVEASANNQAITLNNINSTLKATYVGGYTPKDYARQTIYDYLFEAILAEKASAISDEHVAMLKAKYERKEGSIVMLKSTYEEIFS